MASAERTAIDALSATRFDIRRTAGTHDSIRFRSLFANAALDDADSLTPFFERVSHAARRCIDRAAKCFRSSIEKEMHMEKTQKTFAFRLAQQESARKTEAQKAKWEIRDGVAVAGCTDPTQQGDYRYSSSRFGRDNGVWC